MVTLDRHELRKIRLTRREPPCLKNVVSTSQQGDGRRIRIVVNVLRGPVLLDLTTGQNSRFIRYQRYSFEVVRRYYRSFACALDTVTESIDTFKSGSGVETCKRLVQQNQSFRC